MVRLDVALIQRGMAPSRQRAQELIAGGQISVDGNICTKAAKPVDEQTTITMQGSGLAYVGRGGLKLEKAISCGKIVLDGCLCMDIGASTGGFTDCMLQRGAKKVYAVDVGHDQLAQTLRDDPRVVNLEGTDIRTLSPEAIPEPMDLISVDVSFISLSLILPFAVRFLRPDGTAVLLIKPQFEAGREQIGKHGLVRSRKAHLRVLEQMMQTFSENGLSVRLLCPSPIRGGSGNIEYLAVATHADIAPVAIDVPQIVADAFSKKETEEKIH